MTVVWLENEAMRVGVNPAYGARVTSLVDKATGRDWIAPGGESPATGEDAVYLADEAVGWDECFPTVAPWDATGTAWARVLRDHGDLWGRPWAVEGASLSALATAYETGEFSFRRRLALRGTVLNAEYEVENRGAAGLPAMWALHALLRVTPDDRIVLPSLKGVDATYLAHGGRSLPIGNFRWPGPGPGMPIGLDAVHPVAEQFAAKLYASDVGIASASVGNDGGYLTIAWNADELAHVGLWLNYGGWPEPGAVRHIAIEPTTAPVDDLGGAIANGTALMLAPGGAKRWAVTLTLDHAMLPETSKPRPRPRTRSK
ncbi:MAG: hypothetical protein Q8L54_04800 [Devosia sp.]|nr:hypothetical protein [Devosia sp.]